MWDKKKCALPLVPFLFLFLRSFFFLTKLFKAKRRNPYPYPFLTAKFHRHGNCLVFYIAGFPWAATVSQISAHLHFKMSQFSYCTFQWRIQDFPEEDANHKGGAIDLSFWPIFDKNAWKWKKFAPRKGTSVAQSSPPPPDAPMLSVLKCLSQELSVSRPRSLHEPVLRRLSCHDFHFKRTTCTNENIKTR